jgi:peptide/nickel transport system substrate-binding protein
MKDRHVRLTMKRSLAAVAICIAVLTGIAATAASAASPSPSPDTSAGLAEPVFRVGFSYDIDGMNPLVNYSGLSWEIFRLNYNFLTWYDENGRPVPELATQWQTSPDGKVWTFTIRDDVTWHDGVPLTAKDIAFTYNLILDNQIYFFMSYVKDITKVEAPDATTVVITSKRPNPLMLGLYIPILPEHLWGKIPGKKVETVKDPPTVGSGPFAIAEVKKGSFVKMTANRDYFAGRPTANTLLFQIYTTEDALVQDYKNGTLDIGVFQVPTSLRSIAGVPGSKTVTAPTVGFAMLAFNCWTSPKSKGNPLLQDARIRQAVAVAIDKTRIVETSMGGVAKEGTSVLSPAMGDWHWEPPADQLVTYDAEKAKAILDAAGYTDRDGDGVREDAKGKKLDFKLVALSDYPPEVNAGKMLVPYLKSVGIKVRLEVMDEAAFSDILYGNQGVDMYIWAWGGDLDPSYQLSAFTTDQILNNNDSCYSNPEYDKLFEAQSSSIDRAKRVEVVHQMQEILYTDNPYVVLWYETNLQAYRADRWTGWQLAPVNAPSAVMNYMRGTYIGVKPVAVAASTGGGLGTGSIVALVAGAVIVVGIVIWLVVRRRPKEVEGA